MKQRTVNDLIADLEKVKAEFGGDMPVKVHLKSLEDANGGDYSHDDFCLHIENINEIDGDDGYTILNENWPVLSIFGSDYKPEDYKGKSVKHIE